MTEAAVSPDLDANQHAACAGPMTGAGSKPVDVGRAVGEAAAIVPGSRVDHDVLLPTTR